MSLKICKYPLTIKIKFIYTQQDETYSEDSNCWTAECG